MKETPMPLWKIWLICILVALACSIQFGDDGEFNLTPPVVTRAA
ncbi:hypothetical protein [Burkholderia cenocepacia]|nr:hypothetical protein [Burkholderia cenocepacia]